ncbi:MAG: hypothetical protein JO132_20315 [Streptosporangiaceae bacterium]|nr:hypothetical protein [Streptosporangiaceae bacterium]
MTQVSIDPSFGDDGFVAPAANAFDGLSTNTVGLVRADGGKLVAASGVLMASDEHFYLAAYDAEGRPDTGFGEDGVVVSKISASGSALALQPVPRLILVHEAKVEDMILIGGQVPAQGAGNVFAVQRYTLTGRLDTTFGTDGTALIAAAGLLGPADSEDELVQALAVQPGKGILAAGYAVKPNGSRGALVRLTFDGRLDISFGDRQFSYPYGPGRLLYPAIDAPGDLWGQVPDTDFTSIVIQPNGRILVGGTYGGQFLVARLTPDGAFDPSFGMNGLVLLTLGFGWAGFPTLLLQPDGRIVLTATVGSPTGSGGADDVTAIGLARLLPNGALDTTFGQLIPQSFRPLPPGLPPGSAVHRLGWTIQNVPGTGFEGINDAVLQPGGRLRIIGVGGTQISSDFQGEFLVSGYLDDGDIDTQFSGPAGAIETPFPNGTGFASSCVYDADANTLTVAGGVFSGGKSGIGLQRYLLSG